MYVYRSILYVDAKWCDSACDKTKEIVVELFEYRRKYYFFKEKVRIFTVKVPLEDGKLYTKAGTGTKTTPTSPCPETTGFRQRGVVKYGRNKERNRQRRKKKKGEDGFNLITFNFLKLLIGVLKNLPY